MLMCQNKIKPRSDLIPQKRKLGNKYIESSKRNAQSLTSKFPKTASCKQGAALSFGL